MKIETDSNCCSLETQSTDNDAKCTNTCYCIQPCACGEDCICASVE